MVSFCFFGLYFFLAALVCLVVDGCPSSIVENMRREFPSQRKLIPKLWFFQGVPRFLGDVKLLLLSKGFMTSCSFAASGNPAV